MKQLRYKLEKSFTLLAFLMSALFVLGSNAAYAKKTDDKIKEGIDKAADSVERAADKTADALKRGVEKASEKMEDIQKYLDDHWQSYVRGRASSGVATLRDVKLNGHLGAVAVKPGERVEGEVHSYLNPDACKNLSNYHVVIGLKKVGGGNPQGTGAQTSICNYLGAVAGDSDERFVLIAPAETGMYELRFRVIESLLESTALQQWADEHGNEPDESTTFGILFVKN